MRRWTTKTYTELLWNIDILHILTEMLVTGTFGKTLQPVYLKSVEFIACELYLNKVDLKMNFCPLGFLPFLLSFKATLEWGYNYYKNVLPADANI